MSYYINFSDAYNGFGAFEFDEDEVDEFINEFMDAIVNKFAEGGVDNATYDKLNTNEYNLHVSEKDLNKLKLTLGIDVEEYFDEMECIVLRHNGGHYVECSIRIRTYWYVI